MPSDIATLPTPEGDAAARVEDARLPAVVLAVAAAEVAAFPCAAFVRFAARTTPQAIQLLERHEPRAIVIDWDLPEFDGAAICRAARAFAGTACLVTTASPERVPGALKAGCHSVLLKPITPNLVAARLGRLAREIPLTAAARRIAVQFAEFGTHRKWHDLACPRCGRAGAISFDHASYRRSWFACVQCEAVWLGDRQVD